MMPLLIYIPKVTPRIKYIFNFIFRELLGCDIELTSIAANFMQHEMPKFSYTDSPLADELFFACSPLLSQYQIRPLTITTTTFGDQQVPFAVSHGALPFDVFAASFYFLSRYEEYLPFEADEHGRFPAQQSLQYQLGLLNIPIIDSWALILKNILLKQFPNLVFGKRKFSFLPTFNIDHLLGAASNGIFKNTIRALKAAARFDLAKLGTMIKTGFDRTTPADPYQVIATAHQPHRLSSLFFLLVDKETSTNPDQAHPMMEALNNAIGEEVQIGLLTTYPTALETQKIKLALTILQQYAKRIEGSRQHFLRIQLPQTLLRLLKAGISHDYSMGYASQPGFRAGTCTPFFWYDLQLEKQSQLKIHPFAVMDITLMKYLKLDPKQATQLIDEILLSTKLVNGTFCSLWHCASLTDTGKWKGWQKVYTHLVSSAMSDTAADQQE